MNTIQDTQQTLTETVELALSKNHPTAVIETSKQPPCDIRVLVTDDYIGIKTYNPYSLTDEDITDIQDALNTPTLQSDATFYLHEQTQTQDTAFFTINH